MLLTELNPQSLNFRCNTHRKKTSSPRGPISANTVKATINFDIESICNENDLDVTDCSKIEILLYTC